ncbi:hypothetical protein SAMN02982985_04305 [Rugamonas rubra]|uniref:Uncharacterized protein n=1 Tax=Rugamonas rubra TaxID=758825 RepID=A0A1I4RFS9_9BURK|nr:hypothetical protein SAMN02982985_04305 [Rugamonas rubra]
MRPTADRHPAVRRQHDGRRVEGEGRLHSEIVIVGGAAAGELALARFLIKRSMPLVKLH